MSERVAENLGRALHALLARDERAFVLGEDLADPYGGAFKVTAGLSTAFPGRVLSTPLSENGIVGVAGGLALCGDTVVVEIMFGDFVGLAFDQILNFASKSVSMYGSRVPMRMVVRCPVGGGRGYGATHSQSVQKHFIGIPNLALFELSPFHDASDVLAAALAREEPCLLFEDKVLYTRRMFRDGVVDDRFRYDVVGDWARVHAPAATGPRTLVLAPGGVAHRAVEAAAALVERGRDVQVLVPSRLHPVPVDDLLPLLPGTETVCVVEEGTAGGTWGAEVAARLSDRAWSLLRGPVRLVSSADAVIPAATHLERDVLVGVGSIVEALSGERPGAAPPGSADRATVPPLAHEVRLPRLNSNDETHLLLEWLVADASPVAADEPVALVETSKATDEVTAGRTGVLHHAVPAGTDCAPGTVIARVTDPSMPPAHRASPSPPVGPDPAASPSSPSAPSVGPAAAPVLPAAALPWLSPVQRRVAEVVTASHRDIPSAFSVVRVDLGPALETAHRLSESSGAIVTVADLLVKAAASLHPAWPQVFAGFTTGPASRPVVGVTVDVGTGLFTPVVRDADVLPVADVADAIAALRMKVLRGRVRDEDLTGMNLLVALNDAPGVVHARPIVPPGVTCALSLADWREEPFVRSDGSLGTRRVTDLGLAYDHRVLGGATAAAFLHAVGASLHEQG